MSMVQQAIEVGAPLHTVYEQLAAFENYPRFMQDVEKVTRHGEDQTHWVLDLDGTRREFDATITERTLDQRVAWATTDGPRVAETLTLRPIGETRTQIVAQLEADVAYLLPSDRHGRETLSRHLKSDLDTFKNLCETGKLSPHPAAASPFSSQPAAAGKLSPQPATAGQQLAGRSSTIFGSGRGHDPASPASVAARARAARPAPLHHAPARPAPAHPGAGWGTGAGTPATAHRLGNAHMGMDIDLTSMPGIKNEHDMDDIMAPGRRIGGPGSIRGSILGSAAGATAPMGGQAMSAEDAWGEGMINEEDRGSAHDF